MLFSKIEKFPNQFKQNFKKLFNDYRNLNLDLILIVVDYLNDDIKTTIDKLREYYLNDNTFMAHTNILSVMFLFQGTPSYLSTPHKSC
jgi:hypothetical protein